MTGSSAGNRPARWSAARRQRVSMIAFSAFLAIGTVCVVLIALDIAFAPAFVTLGLLTATATVIGPALHAVEAKSLWRLLTAACCFFVAGGASRPVLASGFEWYGVVPDVLSITAYLLLIAVTVLVLRSRRYADRHAVLDGVTICTGVALAVVVLLAVPAASVPGRPAHLAVITALYPILDVALVLLIFNAAFTTATRNTTFNLLTAGLVGLFVGDFAYAVMTAYGEVAGGPLMHTPYNVAYLCMGLAALHPDIRTLAADQRRPIQSWSSARLGMLCVALAIPSLLLLTRPPMESWTRWAYALAGLGTIAALLARAVSAVRVYSRSQQDLHHQATHDGLTGLANRVLLTERLDELVRRGDQHVVVCFLDLDGFKLLNDSMGHGVGDELLVEVARRLADRLADTELVTRVGGDEFVVVAAGSEVDPEGLATRTLKAFDTPFSVAGRDVAVTPSIGVAVSTPGSAGSVGGLLRDADTALYRVKAEGRCGWALFDAPMHEQVRARMEIAAALRQAVPNGELSVAYQPIVDLADGSMVSAEALLRWHSPTLGFVSPMDFIPVAEDSGMIVEIGAWVLDTALTDLALWRSAGLVDEHFTLSVNLSTRQLRDGELPGVVLGSLARHRVPPGALTLEVTESAMLDDGGTSAGSLALLHEHGVRIAVDDFGTGYSSLSYLRRFPVDVVKIDRAFVRDLDADSADKRDDGIIRAIVGMARALDLVVVAEGVETAAQWEVLRGLEANRGQGWHFGKPMPAVQLFCEGHLDQAREPVPNRARSFSSQPHPASA
jgi:diguanylate cyclase (GGDEF)-like protein